MSEADAIRQEWSNRKSEIAIGIERQSVLQVGRAAAVISTIFELRLCSRFAASCHLSAKPWEGVDWDLYNLVTVSLFAGSPVCGHRRARKRR